MKQAVELQPRSISRDCDQALTRALEAVAKKDGVPEGEVTRRLRARERATWSRLRFELAREVAAVLTQRFPQIRAVHLWEIDETSPEEVDAPADPALDLILGLERNPAGLFDLATGMAKELNRLFGARVSGTPLALTVHLLTRAMLVTGKGMAAVFRAVNDPPMLIWPPND